MCVPREGERECSCVSVRERESSIDCVWRHLVTSMEDERNQEERERGGKEESWTLFFFSKRLLVEFTRDTIPKEKSVGSSRTQCKGRRRHQRRSRCRRHSPYNRKRIDKFR